MTFIVTARFKGADPAKMEEVAKANAETLLRVTEDSQRQGAIHHCFVDVDGEVMVVDEWESLEAFQGFFAANTDIPGVIAQLGVEGPPEVTAWRKLDTPDVF